jgi:YHS domain-containing protein
MTSIWYFALWALLLFVLMRLGCGAHVMGHGHPHRQGHGGSGKDDVAPTAPSEAIDPVCSMTVKPAEAKSSVYDQRIYYFCSTNCREKFESAPMTYLKGGASTTTSKEAHHGAH